MLNRKNKILKRPQNMGLSIYLNYNLFDGIIDFLFNLQHSFVWNRTFFETALLLTKNGTYIRLYKFGSGKKC